MIVNLASRRLQRARARFDREIRAAGNLLRAGFTEPGTRAREAAWQRWIEVTQTRRLPVVAACNRRDRGAQPGDVIDLVYVDELTGEETVAESFVVPERDGAA